MISYCIAVYRPTYARRLLADLVLKTTTPFEILLWLNVADSDLELDIAAAIAAGVPLHVIGRSAENIGMLAYRSLFGSARYPLITQIDDDVVCVSRGIAERASQLFREFPTVRQLVADVWQDEYTTGARPPINEYRTFNAAQNLFEGPIDGWFSIYHRSILPILGAVPLAKYCNLGAAVRVALQHRKLHGVLDLGMKVFHVIGPTYAAAFGMLDFEIEKYRGLGRLDIVDWYERSRSGLESVQQLEGRVRHITECFQ